MQFILSNPEILANFRLFLTGRHRTSRRLRVEATIFSRRTSASHFPDPPQNSHAVPLPGDVSSASAV